MNTFTIDNATINLLFNAIMSVIGILVLNVFIPWMKNKIGEQKWGQLVSYTELAVRSAEQLFTVEEWKQKKEYVLNYVSAKAEEIGINYSAEDIENLIEGLVNEIKKG